MPLRAAIAPALLKWVGGAALVLSLLAGAGWLYHEWTVASLKYDLHKAEASRDAWEHLAVRRGALLQIEREERAAADRAVLALQVELAGIDARHQRLHYRIRDAPPEDDGPVAPVLRRALEELP